jgi:hypothetical protein
MRVIAARNLAQSRPALRQLRRWFPAPERGQPHRRRYRFDFGAAHFLAVEFFQEINFVIGVPADALAAIAEFFHQRAEACKAFIRR